MEASLMKPFITDAFQGGKFVLPFQIEGLPADQIAVPFEKAGVVAYGLPDSHTLKAAWLFRLVLNTGWVVDFSSACTEVGEWQEIGSLNLGFASKQPEDSIRWRTQSLGDFEVKSIERLVYEDAEVYTECGIILTDLTEREIVIAAGPAPGSVSIATPFSTDTFQPELSIERLQRRPL